jgi:hypothetical protein
VSLSRLVLAPRVVGVAVAACVLVIGTANAAGTPGQQCESGKNKAAGKYAACSENAEAKLALTEDAGAYATALQKCEAKFSTAWQKLEAKTTAAGASCPDEPLGETALRAFVDDCREVVVAALAGDGLRICGNGVIEAPDECDGAALGGKTCATEGFAVGALRCASGCVADTSGCFVARFGRSDRSLKRSYQPRSAVTSGMGKCFTFWVTILPPVVAADAARRASLTSMPWLRCH